MAQLLVIALASFVASGLSLFSGFGLGTLLLPVFAFFFPTEVAVGFTAVVHFANNLFKLALLGRRADRTIVLRFGLPAIAASFFGAWTLVWLSGIPSLWRYALFGQAFSVEPVKLTVAALIAAFVLLESSTKFRRLSFGRRFLPFGGLLSGYFGGLSGHQGALRSAFLLKAGLSKEAFIATGIAIACLVDLTRLAVYGLSFETLFLRATFPILAGATLAAFLGAFLGSRLVSKVTMLTVRRIVSLMLLVIAFAMGMGLV